MRINRIVEVMISEEMFNYSILIYRFCLHRHSLFKLVAFGDCENGIGLFFVNFENVAPPIRIKIIWSWVWILNNLGAHCVSLSVDFLPILKSEFRTSFESRALFAYYVLHTVSAYHHLVCGFLLLIWCCWEFSFPYLWSMNVLVCSQHARNALRFQFIRYLLGANAALKPIRETKQTFI